MNLRKLWPKIAWNRPGGLPECPYYHAYIFQWGKFSLRFHHWHADDDHRAPHNHPFWFYTFVLKGGYVDVSYEVSPDNGIDGKPALTIRNIEHMRPFMRRYRPASHLHIVRNVKPGTWTFLICGPAKHKWGFWWRDRLVKRDAYFVQNGHHPCDPVNEQPVRLKPDGTRVPNKDVA